MKLWVNHIFAIASGVLSTADPCLLIVLSQSQMLHHNLLSLFDPWPFDNFTILQCVFKTSKALEVGFPIPFIFIELITFEGYPVAYYAVDECALYNVAYE